MDDADIITLEQAEALASEVDACINAKAKKHQKSEVYFATHYCSRWRRGGLCYHDNGGRKRDECYSATIVIGKRLFSLLIAPINRWRWLLRWIPVFGRRKTLTIGILPKGRSDEH